MSKIQNYLSSNPFDYNVWELIKSDYSRYKYSNQWLSSPLVHEIRILPILLSVLFAQNQSFTYSFYWRIAQKKTPIIWIFAKFKLRRLSRLYGIQIPPSTQIGPGVYIGHGVGIVINGGTVIGKSCNISHLLSIGSTKRTPAVIGDYVYIGPNVSIVENVSIGNNVTIGAGTVVIKDIPDNHTSVGNPNRIFQSKTK